MKSISIIFSKRSGFNPFSQLIMLGLGTPFSHVAVKMIDGDSGRTVYYQASGLTVNCVCEVEFLSKETIVYQKDVQVSDKVFDAGKAFLIDQLGKPYNILAIFGFGLQILLGLLKIQVGNPFKADGSQFVCSQLAGAYVEVCENIDLDITNMTPKALYEIMPSLPDTWN